MKATSPDPILRRLEGLPQVMIQAQRQVAEEAGRLAERTTNRQLQAATGGDGVLSGMTRTTKGRKANPRPIGSYHKVEKRTNGYQAFVRANKRSSLPLVENDQPRHIVVSRWARGAEFQAENKAGKTVRGRSSIQSRQASVAFGLGAAGGGRRAVLNLGGNVFRRWTIASSKGRQPWQRGVDEAKPQLGQIQAEAQRAAIRSALR